MEEKPRIEKLIAEIRPLLPAGWTVSEAIGLDMMGGSTPEFALISTKLPENCRYPSRRETPEQRQARQAARSTWRAEVGGAAAQIEKTLRDNLVGVRIHKDATQIYVYER